MSTLGNLIEIEDIVITNSNGVSISVTDIFVHVTLYDGIFANASSGEISLKDSTRLQELGAIFGDELITISYKDVANNRSITREFLMFANTGKVPNANQKGTLTGYSFISIEAASDSVTRLTKTYRGSAYNIIGQIWDDAGFGGTSRKYLDVDEDAMPAGEFVFCAASWSPFFAIRWILSKLHENGKADWMFFEVPPSEKDHHEQGAFVVESISNMVSEAPKHYYDFGMTNINSTLGGQYIGAAHYSVEAYDALKGVFNGMYSARTLSHDITNRDWRLKNFSYAEEYNKSDHIDGSKKSLVNKHTGLLYTTKYEAHENVVATSTNQFTEPSTGIAYFEEPENPSDEDSKEEYIMHRTSQLRQVLYGPRVNLAVHGNSAVMGGNMLYFDLPVSALQVGSHKSDIYLSGGYLVTSVAHTFSANQFATNIQIAKNSLATQLPGGEAQLASNLGVDGRSQDDGSGLPLKHGAWDPENVTDNRGSGGYTTRTV
jgi:hypothetical protein